MKLFNLKLRDNDHMDLDLEIKAITHDIDATSQSWYCSHGLHKGSLPHYLESLQVSGQMKSLNFDTLVEKIAECGKAFGKKTTQSNVEVVCFAQKEKK